MTKILLMISTLSIVCGACSAEAPPPPDPDAVERLLARMEAEREDPADRLPAKALDKVRRAERFVAPLEKVQADKIDPDLALAVIG